MEFLRDEDWSVLASEDAEKWHMPPWRQTIEVPGYSWENCQLVAKGIYTAARFTGDMKNTIVRNPA